MIRIFFLALVLLMPPHQAEASSFESWVRQFRGEALSQGISADTFDKAFVNVVPNQRVIELDRKQPERTKMGFAAYLSKVMNQQRIDNGRNHLSDNRKLLNSVASRFGVPPEIVVSLWGIETSYGANTGGYDLIQALATLAWEGRRAQFFKTELINALKILQGNHIRREDFKGSWAGAMGQNQFMPSSWHSFAADFDGDGHKDIWKNKADIFASSANYLHRNGWDPALKWGWAINYPQASHFAKEKHIYTDWLKMGVRFQDTPPSIPANTLLTMIVPDGGEGRAYLVTSNFDVIMSWNRSTYFALTVGLLSDFVAKTPYAVQTAPAAYNE